MPLRRSSLQKVASAAALARIVPASRKRKTVAPDSDPAPDHPPGDNKDDAVDGQKQQPRKRKRTAAGAVPEAAKPLAARTDVKTLRLPVYIGAHVSASGGVHNAISAAHEIGANAFGLFLKQQRRWNVAPLSTTISDSFKAAARDLGYDPAAHAVPHGSYLVNLAESDPERAERGTAALVDDLRRCAALGIRLYNLHPGSTPDGSAMGATRIAARLDQAHAATVPPSAGEPAVITLLENMAGGGNVVGARFEELRDIIAAVEDKSRVGVCLDTCHAFAAGYDLRSEQALDGTLAEFDRVVGLKYLKALHLNDSKAPMSSRRDLHANIGTGFLGLRAFHAVVNHPALAGLPMILETPIDRPVLADTGAKKRTEEDRKIWADEIKLLEGLVGADPLSDEFLAKELLLRQTGETERARVQTQVDKRNAKPTRKRSGKKKIGGKGGAEEDEDNDGEDKEEDEEENEGTGHSC